MKNYNPIAQVYVNGEPMCRRDREGYLINKFHLQQIPTFFLKRLAFRIINWLDIHYDR